MEMYRTIRIKCLVCNKIIEANPYSKQNAIPYAKCDCENKVQLINKLDWGDEFSTIWAKDKTKVKAQAYTNNQFAQKNEWFYVRLPEDENTPKFTVWVGETGRNYHTFCEGILVKFYTEEAITPNTCRQLLKKQVIKEQDNHLRVYHFWQQYDEQFEEVIEEERKKVLILKNAKRVTLQEIIDGKASD